MRKTIAVVAIMAATMLGFGTIASAAPAKAPNVVGLSEGDAVATLQAKGIKVRIASRNGFCVLTDQVVHHQQDLSATTRTVSTWDGSVFTRKTVVVPPSTTLNMICP